VQTKKQLLARIVLKGVANKDKRKRQTPAGR
jgi:hypothetical protein